MNLTKALEWVAQNPFVKGLTAIKIISAEASRVRAETIEECAKTCEKLHVEIDECPEMALYCADKIRKMK